MHPIARISTFLGLAVAVFVLLGGCASLSLEPAQATSGVWLTEGESPMRSNAVSSVLDPPLEERWDLNAGAAFGSVSPLIVGQAVLVATRKGEVVAIDLVTGRRLGDTSFGDTIEGTPVIHSGVLYVPVGWGRRALYAYDLVRGETKWSIRGTPISAGLAVHGEHLLVADDLGRVTAYRLHDGESVWVTDLVPASGVKGTPVLVGDVLVVAGDTGLVVALDASTGEILWSTDADAPVYSALAAEANTVFVPTTRGRLLALDVGTGNTIWEYQGPANDAYLSAPAVHGGDVVFGGSDGTVRALSAADGSTRWATSVGAVVSAPVLISQNTIYVGTQRRKLIALRRDDGSVSWETELGGRIKSAFAAKGNRLIVLAEPRTVHMFEMTGEDYALGRE